MNAKMRNSPTADKLHPGFAGMEPSTRIFQGFSEIHTLYNRLKMK
jgi:hypothetical protein